MRSEQDVLNQILKFAENDNDTRAVLMNGSRANPQAPRDQFQDYDIVFFFMTLHRRNKKRDPVNKESRFSYPLSMISTENFFFVMALQAGFEFH